MAGDVKMIAAINPPRAQDALLAENARLLGRLQEVEELLHAIRSGEADAITVDTPAGPRVFALKGAETPYRAIVETMSEGAVTATPDGTILYCNRRFAEMRGTDVSAILGTELPNAFIDTDAAKLKSVLHEDLSSTVRFRASLLQPGAKPMSVNVAMGALDEEPTPAIVIVISDVSEAVAAEEAVSRLGHIVENAGDAIIGKTLDGIITSWNKGAERLYGYSAAEIIGKSVSTLAPPDRQNEVFDLIARLRAGEQAITLETERISKSGQRLNVLLTLSPIQNGSGTITGVSAITHDVTDRKRAEEAAQAASAYARSLIEASLDPLVTIGPDGDITDVNRATEKATGRTRADLIGSDFADYFVEPDKARAGYREAFEQGSVIDYALALRHRSGAVMDVLYNASVYRDPKGEVLGVFAAARDVTSRKRAEASKARATRALRLLNACNTLIIHASDEQALLDETCRTIVELGNYRLVWIGFAREDKNKTVEAVAHAGINGDYVGHGEVSWANNERGHGPTGTAIRTGQPTLVRDTQREPDFAPWRERAEANGYRSAVSLPLIANGTGYGALTIYAGDPDAFDADETRLLAELANDLTYAIAALRTRIARDKAEQELRHVSAYTRSLIEVSLDPLVTITVDGRISDVNQATINVTGASREQLIGSDFSSYFTDPDKARQGYREAFANGSVINYPLSIRDASGRTTDVLYNASLYRDEDGRVAGLFAAARDVTARNHAEAELRKYQQDLEQMVADRTAALSSANEDLVAANKELETFSYSVSHDLRAPLRAIDGFSRVLLDDYSGKLDTEGQRVLNVVRDATVKMSHLIDDILAFSRAGRTEMNLVPVDMEALVRATLAGPLAAAVAGRQIAFEIERLPAAQGDRAMLERVWTNLLDNAIKFTAAKPEARIEIGATAGDSEITYYVRDDGVGFDIQHVGKLFGVFQRLHGAEIPGTGIGLAIVKRLVTRHGGRVWAEGKVDEGATFYFSLPTKGKVAA